MNIGTIGSGSIVEEFIKSARTVEGVAVIATYSRTMERARLFAMAQGIPLSYDDMDAMFNNPEIDFIYIASPNNLHYEQAMRAMQAGKHVILEKPFTGNTEKAKTLIKYAQSHQIFLFEAICNIHMPHFAYIKDQLVTIEPLKAVQCNYSQYSSRYDQLIDGEITNVFNPAFSGGALADLNIYNIHFVVGLFGTPEDVEYIANTYDNGIDTSGIVTLKYPDFVVSCLGAKDSFSKNFGQIQGAKGYIYIEDAVSTIRSVETITKDSKMDYNIQDQPRLSYQIKAFKEIYESKNYERRDYFLKHSYNVVHVAEKARRAINLYFEN